MVCKNKLQAGGLLLTALLAAGCFAGVVTAAETAVLQGCVVAPKSPLVVDVRDKGAKGDGRTNDGPPAELVRDRLVQLGIVVNGLPVMMNRTNFGRPPDLTLDKYYEENVIGGPGSFMIVADDFDHFGRAVRTKLVREISGIDVTSRPTPA